MTKNKFTKKEITVNDRLSNISNMLEKLIAIELYKGGATQPEIADNLGIAVGSVNKLVKGVKPQKQYGKKED